MALELRKLQRFDEEDDDRGFFSKAWDQINFLDGGRTWEQAKPTNSRSAFEQLTNNGATRAVNEAIVPGAASLTDVVSEVPEDTRTVTDVINDVMMPGDISLTDFAAQIPEASYEVAKASPFATARAAEGLAEGVLSTPAFAYNALDWVANKATGNEGIKLPGQVGLNELTRDITAPIAELGKATDEAAFNAGVDSDAYYAAQVAANLAAIGLPGPKGVKQLPKVANKTKQNLGALHANEAGSIPSIITPTPAKVGFKGKPPKSKGKTVGRSQVLDKAKQAADKKRDAAFRYIIDPWVEAARSDRRMGKIPAHRRMTKLLNDAQLAEAKLVDKMRNNVMPSGQTLRQVFQKHQGDEADFMYYVAAKSDLENRNIRGGKPINRNLSKKELSDIVKKYEKKNPGAELDARTIKQFKDAQNLHAANSGVNPLKDTKKLNASREFYFPTKQVQLDDQPKPKVEAAFKHGHGSQSVQQQRTTGSTEPLDYSFEAMRKRFYKDEQEALDARLFRELYRRAGEGKIGATRAPLRKLKDGSFTPNPNARHGRTPFPGRYNGQQRALFLDDKMNHMMAGLNAGRGERGTIAGLAQLPANLFKVLYTGVAAPTFAALNLVKNPVLLLHNQGVGVLNPKAIIAGVQGTINKGKFSEANLTKFGANPIKATESLSRGDVQSALLATNFKSPKSIAQLTTKHKTATLQAAWRKLDHVMAAPDRGLRTTAAKAAYKRAKKAGQSERHAMEAAAEAFNESLGNFNRVTNVARGIEPLLLYSGAMQAGGRAFVRAYRDRPIQTLLMDAAFVGGAGAMYVTNLQSEAGKAFYEDMTKNNKKYILNNNLVIVTPFAQKNDDDTWEGVITIPLAPDFRPLNRAMWKMAMGKTPAPSDLAGHFSADIFRTLKPSEFDDNSPVISVGSVLMNRNTRDGQPIVPEQLQDNPVEEQIDPDYTSGAARGVGSLLGIAPLKIDTLLNDMGLMGDIIQGRDGGPLETTAKDLTDSFGVNGIKGSTSGGRYFARVEKVGQTLDDERDFKTFQALHSSNDKKTIDSSAARAKMLLARPAVLKAENKLNEMAVKAGEPSNPFYELTPEQQQKVLRYRSAKDLNSTKQSYSKDGQSLFMALGFDSQWYQDFRNAEDKFYAQIEKKGGDKGDGAAVSTYSGIPEPRDPAMEKLQDAYFNLPDGSAARSNFLQVYPELLAYWAKNDDFTNAERQALGMTLIGDKYGGGGSGSGSGAVNPYGAIVRLNPSLGQIDHANLPTISGGSFKKTVAKGAPGAAPKVTLKKAKA